MIREGAGPSWALVRLGARVWQGMANPRGFLKFAGEYDRDVIYPASAALALKLAAELPSRPSTRVAASQHQIETERPANFDAAACNARDMTFSKQLRSRETPRSAAF